MKAKEMLIPDGWVRVTTDFVQLGDRILSPTTNEWELAGNFVGLKITTNDLVIRGRAKNDQVNEILRNIPSLRRVLQASDGATFSDTEEGQKQAVAHEIKLQTEWRMAVNRVADKISTQANREGHPLPFQDYEESVAVWCINNVSGKKKYVRGTLFQVAAFMLYAFQNSKMDPSTVNIVDVQELSDFDARLSIGALSLKEH